MKLSQPASDVRRALHPATPVDHKRRLRCASCGFTREIVSTSPGLCLHCATSLEANLAELPAQVFPAARDLALHVLTLPREERAPALAVLCQLGLEPWYVTADYPILEVTPGLAWLALREIQPSGRSSDCATVASWNDVLRLARQRRAALRWPASTAGGHKPLHLEHLLGLTPPPLVWESTPLELRHVETRPNVLVFSLHDGTRGQVAPDQLRYVLSQHAHLGVFALTHDGFLLLSRYIAQAAASDTLSSLLDYRLIKSDSRAAALSTLACSARKHAPPVPADIDYAIACLGTHGSYTLTVDNAYETMLRLAPALLALGLLRRKLSGMAYDAPWEALSVEPWDAEHRGKTLRAIVETAHAKLQCL